MSAKSRAIFKMIEEFSPPGLAEEWDNCGLQVGNPDKAVERILLALDMDDAVLGEALEKKATLIITHHPLIFKGIKKISEDRLPGRLLAQIIRSDITVYAAHTNLDSTKGGVSDILAERLGLTGISVLRPGSEKYLKLTVFVPTDSAGKVREALAGAGAGWTGNYSDCAFMLKGTGVFRPLEGASPFIGRVGHLERVEEIRLETILPARLTGRVIKAMLEAHPYEEVAYDLYPLENKGAGTGAGRVGELKEPVALDKFSRRVKQALNLQAIRYGGTAEGVVSRVAVCGGSGADYWPLALDAGADVLVTGDIGYHTARDMLAAGIGFIDAGHYGTERPVLEALAGYLGDRCRDEGIKLDIFISAVNGDPFRYVMPL